MWPRRPPAFLHIRATEAAPARTCTLPPAGAALITSGVLSLRHRKAASRLSVREAGPDLRLKRDSSHAASRGTRSETLIGEGKGEGHPR